MKQQGKQTKKHKVIIVIVMAPRDFLLFTGKIFGMNSRKAQREERVYLFSKYKTPVNMSQRAHRLSQRVAIKSQSFRHKNVAKKDLIKRWKILKGDKVEIIEGKDVGKQGKHLLFTYKYIYMYIFDLWIC